MLLVVEGRFGNVGRVRGRGGAARTRTRGIADLTGDVPAVLGVAHDPEPGLHDWLRAGVEAPTDALDHLAVDVERQLAMLPAGRPGLDGAAPEAGAALAVALGASSRPVLCDLGRAEHPALVALAEIADVNILVVRGCYLALRRAIHHELLEHTSHAILVDEHGRSLGARDVEDVLGLPVATVIAARGAVARAVDAGTLAVRMPDALARPLRHALVKVGCIGSERAA